MTGDNNEPNSLSGIARDVGRKRGILTEQDRKYLLGRLDIEGQDEYNLQYRLRQRIRHSLFDITLLRYLPSEQLEKIAETIPYYDSDSRVREIEGFSTLVSHLFEFGVRYAYDSPKIGEPLSFIEREFERGLRAVLQDDEYGPESTLIEDISVTVDLEVYDRTAEELGNAIIDSIRTGDLSQGHIQLFVELADRHQVDHVRKELESLDVEDDEARSEAYRMSNYLELAYEQWGE